MQLIPLSAASQPLSPAEVAERLAALGNGWTLREQGKPNGQPNGKPNGVPRLVKTYRTPDFLGAMALAQRLAELAEQVNHHPVLTISWGRLEVQWWTHVLHGLHENDFHMATASDGVVREFVQNSGAGRTGQSGSS